MNDAPAHHDLLRLRSAARSELPPLQPATPAPSPYRGQEIAISVIEAPASARALNAMGFTPDASTLAALLAGGGAYLASAASGWLAELRATRTPERNAVSYQLMPGGAELGDPPQGLR